MVRSVWSGFRWLLYSLAKSVRSALLSCKFIVACEDFSRSHFGELFHICVEGTEQRGDDAVALCGDEITMRVGDFAD